MHLSNIGAFQTMKNESSRLGNKFFFLTFYRELRKCSIKNTEFYVEDEIEMKIFRIISVGVNDR